MWSYYPIGPAYAVPAPLSLLICWVDMSASSRVFKHHCPYTPTFANQGYRINAFPIVKIYCFSRQFSQLTDEKLVFQIGKCEGPCRRNDKQV